MTTTLLNSPHKGLAPRSAPPSSPQERAGHPAPFIDEHPAPAAAASPPQARRRLLRFNRPTAKRIVALLGLSAALLAGGTYGYSYWVWSRNHISTDNAFIDAHIVQVSPRVAGHVARVYVDDNQFVHAGDLLLELDPADYQAALDEARAKLIATQADLTAAQAAVEESRAQIHAGQAAAAQAQALAAQRDAELKRAQDDLAQYAKARESAAVSTLEYGKAQTALETGQASADAAQKAVAAAQAQVGKDQSALQSREAEVAVARAHIEAAQAAVDRAALNLSYTKITAAADGRITKKSVEPGNYIIPAQPILAMVAPNLWITANFKETQLAHMQPGQSVEVEVDAYPGMELKGHVDSIQQGAGARFSLLPPENATGNYVKVVQRVPVKIVLDQQPASGQTLGPGMSVVPTVTTR